MTFSSDSVQVFLAALDHGSFSAAARALSRVPSAVSMTIAHLEAELDIALFDRSVGGGRWSLLSPGSLDESPSFAPNAAMVLYAAREGRRGVLYAVSADGRVRQRLVLAEGDVREPAWSPYRKK